MRGRGGEGDWHQELTVLFSPGILREKRTVSYHGNVIFQPGARATGETRKWKKICGIVTCICLCKPQDQNRLAEANTVSGPQQYGHDGGVLSLGSLCSKLTTKLQSLMTPATLQWPSEMVAESQLLRSWVLSGTWWHCPSRTSKMTPSVEAGVLPTALRVILEAELVP